MKFDKTCCGTTCDARANAEYVAKLEEFVSDLIICRQQARYYDEFQGAIILGSLLLRTMDRYPELIKHAQQNNSTN